MSMMAVGLERVEEVALAAQDADGGTGHADERARQVTHTCAATAFATLDIPDTMETTFDSPMASDQGHQPIGGGSLVGNRGRATGRLGGAAARKWGVG